MDQINRSHQEQETEIRLVYYLKLCPNHIAKVDDLIGSQVTSIGKRGDLVRFIRRRPELFRIIAQMIVEFGHVAREQK